MRNKIIQNVITCLVAAAILSGISYFIFYISVWLLAAVFFLFFFITASIYGDEEFNITVNWSPRAKRIKNVIGNIFAFLLLSAGFLFLASLLGLLVGVNDMLIAIGVGVVIILVIISTLATARK